MCRGANSSRSNATATTTSPKKLISVLSVFIAMILTYLDKCTRILLNLNSKGPYSSSESEIKFRRCLFTFFIKLKRRTCAKTAKKCTKKRDARAKLLFCLWNLVFFFYTFSLPSRCWILKSLIFFPLSHWQSQKSLRKLTRPRFPLASKVANFPAIFILNRPGKGSSQCILHVSWEGLLLFYLAFCFVKKEDEDEEAEVPSETEAGEEGEVDVCTVERIPALCSRCELWNKCKCSHI